MSLINTSIKPFVTHAYQNNTFSTVSNSDLEGKWSILFFYPADFTFVCPTELEDLANHYEDFTKNGAEVYSVSTDTHFTHKAWHDASDTIKKIKYKMIGDPAGVLSRHFNVYNEDTGLASRATFVINPQGQVQIIEITCDGVGRDAKELLRKFKAAKFTYENPGQVCPAKWQEGDKTLTPGLDLIGKI